MNIIEVIPNDDYTLYVKTGDRPDFSVYVRIWRRKSSRL